MGLSRAPMIFAKRGKEIARVTANAIVAKQIINGTSRNESGNGFCCWFKNKTKIGVYIRILKQR